MPAEGKSWTYIDEVERRALLLDDSDMCYYYLVRTSGGFSTSEANNRIDNFKKKPEHWKSNPNVWQYKTKEIDRFADNVCSLLMSKDFAKALKLFRYVALTPAPTSLPKSHEHYDSRLVDMCRIVAQRIGSVHLEDVLDTRCAMTASHAGGSRNVLSLMSNMTCRPFQEEPDLVILVDDVLTTGAHFVACRDTIRTFNPSAQVIGLFLALHRSDWVDYGALGIEI